MQQQKQTNFLWIRSKSVDTPILVFPRESSTKFQNHHAILKRLKKKVKAYFISETKFKGFLLLKEFYKFSFEWAKKIE